MPRPNTDTAIMLGLAHTLVAEGLHDTAFLERYSVGFERFLPYLMGESDGQPKDARWAAAISRLDAETIRDLARRMAANRTLISVSWSIQRADHGEQPYWMAVTLAAMLGQIGLPAGGFGFGYGAVASVGNPVRSIPGPNLPQGTNAVESFIPVARISDLLLNGGGSIDYDGRTIGLPDIRLVYWCGGNPFHHHQDINRLLAAWQIPETIITHEPWWNPSARHADIVLPCTTTLERNDLGCASGDNYMFAMHQVIPAVGSARNDFDILGALADRLGFAEAFTENRSETDWLRYLYNQFRQRAAERGFEAPEFARFWDQGHIEYALAPEPRILFQDFRNDPDAHPLETPSGRLEIFSETIHGFGYDDCPGHPVWIEPIEWLGSPKANKYPLHLISNQPKTRLHSQYDLGAVSQASKVGGREPVMIHPEDAAGARHRQWRRGAPVQRPRRLPRRRRGGGGRAARRGAARHRRLVRPPRARQDRQPRSPGQSQYADAGQGHVQAGAGRRWPRAPSSRSSVTRASRRRSRPMRRRPSSRSWAFQDRVSLTNAFGLQSRCQRKSQAPLLASRKKSLESFPVVDVHCPADG